jgi:hypothetical protein
MKTFLPLFGDLMLPDTLPAPKHAVSEIKKFTSSGDYLGRVQLITSNSELGKSGVVGVNNYAYILDNDHVELGKTVDVAVLAWRPMALDVSNPDEVITSYDPQPDANGQSTGEFARIEAQAEVQDSGCMFGPQFLLYVPQIKKFATLFMGTKSSRRVAPELANYVRKAATLDSQQIKTKKYSWFTNKILPCSASIDLPMDEAVKQINLFDNPPAENLERVEPTATAETRER